MQKTAIGQDNVFLDSNYLEKLWVLSDWGRLGKMMVKIGNGFGMNVIGYDVLNIDYPDVQKVTLDELLKTSDVITIHIHLTSENVGFISEKFSKK